MENNEKINVVELNEENLEEVSGGKSANRKVKATGDVYMRREPDKESEQIGLLYTGDTLPYLGEKQYDYRDVAWFKVSCKGRTGWVSSRFSKLV